MPVACRRCCNANADDAGGADQSERDTCDKMTSLRRDSLRQTDTHLAAGTRPTIITSVSTVQPYVRVTRIRNCSNAVVSCAIIACNTLQQLYSYMLESLQLLQRVACNNCT